MSQYYACTSTSKGLKLKNVELFKKDLQILNDMFDGQISNCLDFEYHEEEPYVFVSADENGGLEMLVENVGGWYERLPPDDWTDEQKRAHAETFGYLHYHKKFFDGDEIKVIRFFREHLVEGEIAIINGVSHEKGDPWYWTVAFTHDREEWLGLDTVGKLLQERLKQPKDSP